MDRSSKNPGPAPEHRLNIILEELQSQFRTFGDGLTDVQEKVESILKRLDPIEEDLRLIKSVISVIPTLATKKDLQELEKRLKALETH